MQQEIQLDLLYWPNYLCLTVFARRLVVFPFGQIPTVSHQQYISLSTSESPQTSVVRCTLFNPSTPEYIDTILILNLRIASYSGLETGTKNLL